MPTDPTTLIAPVYGSGCNNPTTPRGPEAYLAFVHLVRVCFGRKYPAAMAEPEVESFLAQIGCSAHATTYARGMDDEGFFAWLQRELGDEYEPARAFAYLHRAGPLMLRFAARWFGAGLPSLMLPETYMAELLCTAAPDALARDLLPPWPAFTIRVPPKVFPYVTADGREASVRRVSVLHEEIAGGSYWTLLISGDHNPDALLFLHRVPSSELLRTMLVSNIPVEHLENLVPGPDVGQPADNDAATFELAGRLVVGVCLAMQGGQERVQQRQRKAERHRNRAYGEQPATWLVRLGEPVEVDMRSDVRAFVRGEKRQGRRLTVQTMVRMHWKRQHHGPKNSLVKWVRIRAHWRGPVDAPIQAHTNLGG